MSTLKSKNKISLVFILLISILVSLVLTVSVYFARADVSVEVSGEVASEYAFGDKLTLPTCTFTKGGASVVAKPFLQYPDGRQVAETEVTLNQSGNYVLKYIATVDDQIYTKEVTLDGKDYSFTVRGKLATYKNAKTEVSYGLCNHLGANSMGLNVRIANGDSITFNHVFDMNSLALTDTLLEGFIVPDVAGQIDFAQMIFTFTDVEDPSVQLVYHGNFHNDSRAYGLTWFTAAGNGQVHCGLEYIGKLWKGETQGCMVPHSFMAMDTGLYWGALAPTPVAPDAKTFSISYDYKNNQAWAGGKIISDLDDGDYYDKLWFGFPSGKAKLTISASSYNGPSANMCFTNIFGIDLSANDFIDDVAPEITVDNESETMPTALKGLKYPVPTARALDAVCGETDVKISVWYDYQGQNQKSVNVENGRFKVDRVGVYAIVYEATDFSGNVGREVLWVRALNRLQTKLAVSLDAEYNTQIEVGKTVKLPEPKVVGGSPTVVGGSDKYNISYEITKGKLSCEIVDGKFTLEQSGEWELVCKVTDYIGNGATKTLLLTAVNSGKPITNETPKLQTAYVSGNEYLLPTLYAYDYTSGEKVEKLCQVEVVMGGKISTYDSGDFFVPMVETSGEEIAITYLCDGEVLYNAYKPVVIVFEEEEDDGRIRTVIKTQKYFYTTDDLTLTNGFETANVGGLKITANSDMESAKLSFINAQLANYFSIDFFTLPNLAKFTQLNVIVKDSIDESVAIKASFIKDGGQTLLKVGDTQIALLLDFDASSSTFYSVGYKNGALVINGTTAVAIDKTVDGKDFAGFTSNKIFFEIEMVNVEKDASIFIQRVCGINVSNGQDNTGPYIQYVNSVQTSAMIGDVYTIGRVVVGDVLAPNSHAYLTVKTPSGEIAESIDGIRLSKVDATKDYQINMAEYGDYKVSILAVESANWKKNPNESPSNYTITVIDGEKPTITFENDFKTNLSVGERLVIPKFTVSDNFSKPEDITVLIMVINPKGMPVYLYGETNAVKCEYVGEYKVCFYVYDQMGNLTTVEKTVTVK